VRRIYGGRREAMVAALTEHMGDRAKIVGDSAGMHLIARLETGLADAEVVKRVSDARVELASSGRCYIGKSPEGEFMFGFAALGERRIQEGVRRIHRALGVN